MTAMHVGYPEADMFGVTPDHIYAYRLLDAASDVYSRWFMVMKSAVSRERVRRRLLCEESGMSVNTRIPYERPALTASEHSTVSLCKNLVSSLFDPKVAEYAMIKFMRAIDTGDMRSFKIRLLVLKSRDSLKGTRLYKGFSEGAKECITKAESIAGCVPDPSPRRLSKVEKARAAAKKRMYDQPTLFDNTEEVPRQDAKSGVDQASEEIPSLGQMPTSPACSVDNVSSTATLSGVSPVSRDTHNVNVSSHWRGDQYIDKCDLNKGKRADRSISKNKSNRKNNIDYGNVTVTPNSVTVTDLVAKNVDNSSPVRKTKKYTKTSEISQDIKAGAIVPYRTNDEVVADVRKGVITPSEAVLFLSELVKRKRSDDAVEVGDAVTRDIDRRMINSIEDYARCRGNVIVDEMDDDENEIDEELDAEDSEDADRDCVFGDCGGYKSSEAEWRPDDNW